MICAALSNGVISKIDFLCAVLLFGAPNEPNDGGERNLFEEYS